MVPKTCAAIRVKLYDFVTYFCNNSVYIYHLVRIESVMMNIQHGSMYNHAISHLDQLI